VIPSTTGTTTCSNVTIPPVTLGVIGTVQSTSSNGSVQSGQPWSQYGWIDQCTDISLLPTNGTPPYTLTIAPSLHPPYNITAGSVEALNWTVGLSWAAPFFVSVFDSAGHAWASGPLHSGGPGTTGCLSQNSTSLSLASVKQNPPPAVSVGAGVGGLALGVLLGGLAAYFLSRRREHHREQQAFEGSKLVGKTSTPGLASGLDYDRPMSSASSDVRPTLSYLDGSVGGHTSASNTRANRAGRGPSTHYQVEALVLPGEGGPHHSTPSGPETETASHYAPSEADNPSSSQQVYVVHHDAGRPPVTVYAGSGAEVVELPPSYLGRNRTASGPSGARPNLSERRSPGPIAKKTLLESQTYTRDPPT